MRTDAKCDSLCQLNTDNQSGETAENLPFGPADLSQGGRAEFVENQSSSWPENTARNQTINPGAAGVKGQAKVVTSRTFKGPAGLKITAERAKGLDLIALVESFRSIADQIEQESADAQ